MTFLYRYSMRHPAVVLVIAALAVTTAAGGILRLKLRTDGGTLVPTGDPEVAIDRTTRDLFGVEDVLVVLIRSNHADGIFNTASLRLIQTLTREVQGIDGMKPHHVASLQTEHNHRVKPGTLHFRRFLEPLPDTPEALATLRSDLGKIQLHTGTVISFDGSAASILVGVPLGMDRTALYREVQEIIATLEDHPEQIDVIGAPVAEALLGTHLLQDLGVPRPLLGLGPDRSPAAPLIWPGSVEDLRGLIARTVGLVPIAMAIMGFVFLIAFRSLAAALLPLMEVGACLLAVFGLMGWCDVPVYLTIAVMPVILTAIGVADEIHIFSRYVQQLRTRGSGDHLAALKSAMDEMWKPVLLTSITTCVGFLSFAFSPLAPVRAFGIFTAVGILFCLVWSLTVVPAMLAMMPPRWLLSRRSASSESPGIGMRLFALWARAIGRMRFGVIAIALMAMVVAPFAVAKVNVQDSWIEGFAPSSAFRRATRFFNEQFLGTHLLLMHVRTPHQRFVGQIPASALDHHEIILPGDMMDDPENLVGHWIRLRMEEDETAAAARKRDPYRAMYWRAPIEKVHREDGHIIITTDRRRGSPLIALRPQKDATVTYEVTIEPLTQPDVIRRIGALEAFVADQRERTVGGVIGTATLLTTSNYMARGLKPESRVIPNDPERIRWVWNQYKRIRGPERFAQIVDEEFGQSLVTVFLKNANFKDVEALMISIRDYEREHLAPHGISLSFAGDVAISQTLIGAIVKTQCWSLLGGLLGIVLITALVGRSIGWGCLCVLPCVVAVLMNFAVMGLIGMPLGVATSMFAGMTLGIGVDYAIHLLSRYRVMRNAGNASRESVRDALTVAGPPILIDAAGVALGFAVLTLSQVPPNARLGALLLLSIIGCLVATLAVLPALLLVRSRPTLRE